MLVSKPELRRSGYEGLDLLSTLSSKAIQQYSYAATDWPLADANRENNKAYQ